MPAADLSAGATALRGWAVERAAALLAPYGAGIVEYTSQADAAAIPGHYVVYWELLATADPEQ